MKWLRMLLKKRCNWESTGGLWAGACGAEFYDLSETGNPTSDWVHFCHNCGGPIKFQ